MDRRGSAILLVLVAMVLMAILAGSLLQLTRFERIPRAESNIEVVIASVIDEILNQLTEDLIDDTGLFLNTAGTAGGYDEPYDYPWTNNAVTGERRPENSNGVAQTNVLGGRFDDTWLAAHMPAYSSAADTVGTWQKITSLTGIWLGGAGGSADLSGVASPNEYNHSSLTAAINSDTNIATNSGLLVDADGDGIGDSRWEWAPLRQVGATQYVMAVRIVDLSARMDVNVATRIHGDSGPSATSFSGANLGVGQPRGDSPAELDGSGFIAQMADATAAINGTNARSEWVDVLKHRLTGDSASAINPFNTLYDNNIDPPSAGSRRDYWTKGASRVSNTLGRNGEDSGGTYDYSSDATFGLTDAFELLQGNGLNSDNATTLEDIMPTFLRRNTGGPEDGYATGAGTNQPNGWTTRQFWELDPRKHITTHSGVSSAAKPIATGQARQLKLDVNRAVETGNLTALRDRILAVLNTNPPTWGTAYPHLTNTTGVADQLAANIADYIDDDNLLTEVGTATGFEALPFISEVYTQRYYQASAVNTTTTPSTVTWTAEDTAQGYVIEIANPFAPDTSGTGRPVSLENIWIDMNGTATALTTYTGTKTELAPGEVLLLYQNSGGPLNALDTYHSANANNTAGGFTPANTTVVLGPAMDATAATQTIGLQAAIQGAAGSPAGWNYSACVVEVGGASVDAQANANTIPDPPAGYFSYIQTHYAGHATGLRMMTVTKGGGSNDYIADITTLQDPSINCNVAGTGEALQSIATTLANETKASSPGGFANLANDQIVWPDSERERLHWIGDILQIPLIGPRANAATEDEMAEAFISAAGGTSLTSGIEDLLLPYNAGTTTLGTGTLNYPHTVLLLEQLTTFNPASDGEDGDGQNDSTGESVATADLDLDEVLVPGKLNINTAPYDTLVRLLPFPDLPTREAVASTIITRRQNTTQATTYGTGVNARPGITYTSALYEQLATLANGATPSGTYTNISTDSADSTTLGASGVRIDLNDHETALGTYVPADGVADDREEELMLAKWLTEMCDTRSDVFAAYIVVQGYTVDSFNEGATESARLIVLFSRANVDGAGDKAVEIGRYRIN